MSKAKKAYSYVNVFDFDYTIYDGDCSIDFFKYCLKKKPSIIRYLPYQMLHYILFILKLENRTEFKSRFFSYLKSMKVTESLLDNFWSGHKGKIKDWYRAIEKDDDIIISASPEFLLKPILNDLKTSKLIATRVNHISGGIIGKNCYGEEKVRRLNQEFTEIKIVKAFTDSLSDLPLLGIAEQPYLVIGNKITALDEFKKFSKLKRFILTTRLTSIF